MWVCAGAYTHVHDGGEWEANEKMIQEEGQLGHSKVDLTCMFASNSK